MMRLVPLAVVLLAVASAPLAAGQSGCIAPSAPPCVREYWEAGCWAGVGLAPDAGSTTSYGVAFCRSASHPDNPVLMVCHGESDGGCQHLHP